MTAVALFLAFLKCAGPNATAVCLILLTAFLVAGLSFFLEAPVVCGGFLGAVMGKVMTEVFCRGSATVEPMGMLSGALLGAVLGDLAADFRFEKVITEPHRKPYTRIGHRTFVLRWARPVVLWLSITTVLLEISALFILVYSLPPNNAWENIEACYHDHFVLYDPVEYSPYSLTSILISLAETWPVHVALLAAFVAAILVRRGGVNHPCYEQRLFRVGLIHALTMVLWSYICLETFILSFQYGIKPVHFVDTVLWIPMLFLPFAAFSVIALVPLAGHFRRYWRTCDWLIVAAAASVVDVVVAILGLTYLLST